MALQFKTNSDKGAQAEEQRRRDGSYKQEGTRNTEQHTEHECCNSGLACPLGILPTIPGIEIVYFAICDAENSVLHVQTSIQFQGNATVVRELDQ
jgi:3-deoxy-D-arabino-heptulosonate 7-phosphate (DAHP) synthase